MSNITNLTLPVAGSYASGDYIGPSASPASFSNIAKVPGGRIFVKTLVIIDKQINAAVAMELWLFSATFVAPTDNGVWTISDTEAQSCVGVIPIVTTKWQASGANKIYMDDTIGIIINPPVATLYFALVPRGTTLSWAANDLTLLIGTVQVP